MSAETLAALARTQLIRAGVLRQFGLGLPQDLRVRKFVAPLAAAYIYLDTYMPCGVYE